MKPKSIRINLNPSPQPNPSDKSSEPTDPQPHNTTFSLNIPATLTHLSPISISNKLPASLSASKPNFQSFSNIHNINTYSNKNLNSIQLTAKTRILTKDKLFSSSDSIPTTLNPHTVLSYFKHELTEHEKVEIVKFDDVYFFGKICNKIRQKEAYDDERGDYLYRPGDHIAYRYEIIKLLGKGNFGQVLLCHDHKRREKVTVKIVRNKKKFNKQAAVEVKVLQALKDNDIGGKKSVLKMKTFFMFRKHVCIVFEVLTINLFDLLQQNNFEGFSLNTIKKFTSQILTSLDLTSKLRIIHCDLKPENIMLVSNKSTALKVIDYGTSCYEHEKIYTYIQSRYYRAPEIILGLPYTVAIDMWSLGCMVAEFYTGSPLFTGESEQEQIALFVQALGMPPARVVKASGKTMGFFERGLREDSKDKEGGGLEQALEGASEEMMDFVRRCLEWDPVCRLRPGEGLEHPFIGQGKNKRKKGKVKKGIRLINS